MKKGIFAITLAFLLISTYPQSCLPEGIELATQAQIDSFQINYPSCKQIGGDVIIGFWGGSDIYNLFPLSCLTSILGKLELRHNDLLPDLFGLHNLDSIYGSLSIGGMNYYWGNDLLTDFSGLTSLIFIGENLLIYSNQNLESLKGLENLTTIAGGTIEIQFNHSMISLVGLNNLVTDDLHIRIDHNYGLTHLTGLECFNSMGGFFIGYNDGLLDLTGLDNIQTIESSFWIVGNSRLKNLFGLQNLTQIGGSLIMNGNDSLLEVEDLSNLSHLGGELYITVNDLISSLSGLDNIDPEELDSLTLVSNHSLSECEIQGICEYINNPTGSVLINDNANGCNSAQEVLDSCEANSVQINEQIIIDNLVLYPNPASKKLNFSAEGITIDEVAIYTLTGQQVLLSRPTKESINISILNPGMYIFEVAIENIKLRRKLIVQ